MASAQKEQGHTAIIAQVPATNAAQIKDLAFQLKNEVNELFCVLVADLEGKPSLSIMISDSLVKSKDLHAGNLVREWAKHIKGGGGGQAFFAQAGGSDSTGLNAVLEKAKKFSREL